MDSGPDLLWCRVGKRPHFIDPIHNLGKEAGVFLIKISYPARFSDEGNLTEAVHHLLDLGLGAAKLSFHSVNVIEEVFDDLFLFVCAHRLPIPLPNLILNGLMRAAPEAMTSCAGKI